MVGVGVGCDLPQAGAPSRWNHPEHELTGERLMGRWGEGGYSLHHRTKLLSQYLQSGCVA